MSLQFQPDETATGGLLAYCETEAQRRVVQAVLDYGGVRKGAIGIGHSRGGFQRTLGRVKALAAAQGYAPEHNLTHTVPTPFIAKGHSTLYDGAGNVRLQWVKTKLDDELRAETIREAFAAMAEDMPRLPAMPAPAGTIDHLCNLYTLTDSHVGMLAWRKEAMLRTDEFGGGVFQPYSVRFGDRWYSFERADPLGQGMGLLADMAELMKNADWDSDRNGEWDEVAAHAIMAIGQAFFDKTILQGATEFTSAILDGTTADAERLLMKRASGAIPGSSALRMVRRGQDPYIRETWNVVSAIRNAIPGFSDELPPSRDLWGKARTYQTGLGTVYDAVVPVQTRQAGGSSIDLEILNNGVSVQMPGRTMSVMGESVSLKNRPDIYSDFLQLSGEPAFEHLNAVAEGRHADSEFYLSLSDGPEGGKAEYIKDVISAYRQDARAMILDKYAADLQDMAMEKVRRREDARSGGW